MLCTSQDMYVVLVCSIQILVCYSMINGVIHLRHAVYTYQEHGMAVKWIFPRAGVKQPSKTESTKHPDFLRARLKKQRHSLLASAFARLKL